MAKLKGEFATTLIVDAEGSVAVGELVGDFLAVVEAREGLPAAFYAFTNPAPQKLCGT